MSFLKGQIKRIDVPIRQLLYDQDCFEIFMRYINSHDVGLSIQELQREGMLDDHYINSRYNLKKACEEELNRLDENKPFLKFGYPGTHYGYELFLSDPEHWGLRGSPFMWAHCARAFSRDILPMEPEYFEIKYRELFKIKGIPFEGDPDGHTYCKELAFGGMSSGCVTNNFGITTLSQLLHRLTRY